MQTHCANMHLDLEKLASRDNHRLYLAIAHRALGVGHRLAGEHAAAETRLKQALELFTKLGARWQIGRTLFELGELNLDAIAEKDESPRILFTSSGLV